MSAPALGRSITVFGVSQRLLTLGKSAQQPTLDLLVRQLLGERCVKPWGYGVARGRASQGGEPGGLVECHPGFRVEIQQCCSNGYPGGHGRRRRIGASAFLDVWPHFGCLQSVCDTIART